MIRIDIRLELDPATQSVREMIDAALRHGRLVWAGSWFYVSVLCWIAWRVDSAINVSPFPVWDSVGLIYTAAVVAAGGSLLIRRMAYDRAGELREKLMRSSLATVPEPQADSGKTLADALVELSRSERSVWALASGPTLLGVPCTLLSGDATPMWPLVLASVAALLLARPQPDRFAEQAGATGPGMNPGMPPAPPSSRPPAPTS